MDTEVTVPRPWAVVLVYINTEYAGGFEANVTTSVAISTVIAETDSDAVETMMQGIEVQGSLKLAQSHAHPIDMDRIAEELRRAAH